MDSEMDSPRYCHASDAPARPPAQTNRFGFVVIINAQALSYVAACAGRPTSCARYPPYPSRIAVPEIAPCTRKRINSAIQNDARHFLFTERESDSRPNSEVRDSAFRKQQGRKEMLIGTPITR